MILFSLWLKGIGREKECQAALNGGLVDKVVAHNESISVTFVTALSILNLLGSHVPSMLRKPSLNMVTSISMNRALLSFCE